MKLGNFKIFIFCFTMIISNIAFVLAEDKIKLVPLINLEELSPTFEEDKDELEKIEEKKILLNKKEKVSDSLKPTKNDKIY